MGLYYIYNQVVYLSRGKKRYNIYSIGDDDDVKWFEWWENTREQTSMPESARAYIYGTIHQYTSI